MLPYEVPLPFNIAHFYTFLKKMRFSWIDDFKFKVETARFGTAEKYWLELVFDGLTLGSGHEEGIYTLFDLRNGGRKKADLRHPYKYWARRNNGKTRNLALPHPQSMLTMAYFIHEYRDSILYYTNRSSYSIRHPRRVARLHAQKDTEFTSRKDKESYGVEQSDLEYEYVTSYFSYARYNNLNRFYSSQEFRACERKYPRLLRADVSKCFDSIYTHTVSWVTNGADASKVESEAKSTFGGKFDHYMQYLNYGETSGIIIGPEFSRVFAEIIMQEVDVRVERDLADKGKVAGRDYEIMRYVDDYFVFLANSKDSSLVEEVLARNLADFKLHLNDHKQHEFDTPLKSHMSVAKLRLRENLKARTVCEVDLEGDIPHGRIHLSAREAILDYKATLIDSDLDHGEVANSYLYALTRRVSETVKTYRKYLAAVREHGDPKKLTAAQTQLTGYLVANLDVALFVYAGAPSVSHSLKVTRLVVALLKELQDSGAGLLQIQSFRDKVFRELEAQLAAVRDESAFGVHTLLLVDCLIFMNPEISEDKLLGILERRGVGVHELDAFGVLTFLRRFAVDHERDSRLKKDLLLRARALVDRGASDPRHNAERVILRLSLPSMPGLTVSDLRNAADLSKQKAETLRRHRNAPSLFAWNANENYYERLQLKIAQMVY
jgi:hypothetical protein